MSEQTLNPRFGDHDDHDKASTATFGWWMFLLSDFLLFATLFISYVVLYTHTYGEIGIRQIASLPYVLAQSLVLLGCSLTFGLTMRSLYNNHKNMLRFWLSATFILGVIFVDMQWNIASFLLNNGFSWHKSAFLSIYFVLLGTHALHVMAALLWIVILTLQLFYKDISPIMRTRFTCLGLFWAFLNIIWVFIFIVVYLMGAI